jgi:polar amino acid transport system substrate-binding protein
MRALRNLICCLLLFTCGLTQAQDCHLRVGWEEWYPLIHERDGQLTGSEFELLSTLAKQANCQLEFIELPWIRALRSLQISDIDLLYGASKTPERETFAQFSQPYRVEQMLLLTHLEDQTNPGPISLNHWLATPNASGKPRMLGVILGFYYGDNLDPIVQAPEAQAQRLRVRWDQQLLKLLKAKRIDGYLIEASIAPQLTQQNSQALQQHQVSEQKPEPMHLMFSHKVPAEIVQRFDAAIAAQAKP